MRNGVVGLAVLGAIAIGTSGAVMAQTCPPGQMLQAGRCVSVTGPGMAVVPPPPAGSPRGNAAHPENAMTVPGPAPVATAVPARPAAPAPAPGSTAGRFYPTAATTRTTTVQTGTSMPPRPAVASPTAGTTTVEKREVCPAGFVLYKGGCAPAQDAANALFK